MIKWFAYIVLLLVIAPALSSASAKGYKHPLLNNIELSAAVNSIMHNDTAASKNAKRQQEQDDKKKIKELAKARRQPKPEKLGTDNTPQVVVPNEKKQKPKRQRRPEGMERPPEIPRRNGD